MRVVCVGYPYVSKFTVRTRLLELHKATPIDHVVGWAGNVPSGLAVDWADEHNINCALVGGGSRVGVLYGRETGRKAEIATIFKVYAPNCLLVFGDDAFIEGGPGKTFVSQAEMVGAEMRMMVAVFEPGTFGMKPRELCGVTRPKGKAACGKFKGHPGVTHVVFKNGRKHEQFVLPKEKETA